MYGKRNGSNTWDKCSFRFSISRVKNFSDSIEKVSKATEKLEEKLKKLKDYEEAKKYYNKLKEISDNSPLIQTQVYETAGALVQAGIGGEDIAEYIKKD